MQEIEQRSDGAWRPSPGSVYPALQQLEDEGLVRSTETDGRRAYELTYEGQQHVEEHREQLGTPWDAVREDAQGGPWNIGHLIRQVAVAATQIIQTGTEAQVAEAESVLKDARRALYRILAEDEPSDDDATVEDA
jgi:DNA-binding PadR family transcriptional regulator